MNVECVFNGIALTRYLAQTLLNVKKKVAGVLTSIPLSLKWVWGKCDGRKKGREEGRLVVKKIGRRARQSHTNLGGRQFPWFHHPWYIDGHGKKVFFKVRLHALSQFEKWKNSRYIRTVRKGLCDEAKYVIKAPFSHYWIYDSMKIQFEIWN